MARVTVRADEATKRRMEEPHNVNWNRILRESIKRKLKEEDGKNLVKAVVINNQLQRRAPKGWDTVKGSKVLEGAQLWKRSESIRLVGHPISLFSQANLS